MNKISIKKIAITSFILLVAFFNFSCQSTKLLEKVELVELLDTDSTFYISIPVKNNFEFSKYLVLSFLSKTENSIKEKDLDKLLKRIENLYVAVNPSTKEYQMSASGNFPKTLSKLFLTEKKGWSKKKFNSHTYSENKQTGFDLAFITSDIACFSSNSTLLEKQLSRYDDLLANKELEKVDLEISETDLTFYLKYTKDFLAFRLGGIKSVNGKLVQIKDEKKFDTSIVLDLENQNQFVAKAIVGLVKISLNGVTNKISLNDNKIYVEEVILDWNQLSEMISLGEKK